MRTDEPADDPHRTEEPVPDEPEPDYADLFKLYIVQSAESTLATLAADVAADWDEAHERALHILSFSLALPAAWPTTRELLLQLAPKMEQAGHRDDWLPYLERGVTRSQAQADPLAEAELARFMGELFRLRSKFDLARQWLERSVTIFTTLGADQGQASALNELAFVAWQQHYYDEAEALAQRALTRLDANDPERATCFSRLGLVAIDLRQWPEAEQYHRTALEIRMKQGDQRKIAWSLQNIGDALRGQRKYIEAVEYYEKAITILEAVKDKANVANVQVNLGIAFSLAGQSDKALKAYSLAEHAYKNLHDRGTLARVYNNQGIEYLLLQQWQEAQERFLACIELHREVGDTSFRLNALDGLGLAYFHQKLFAEAIAAFELILAELSQIKDTPMYNYLKKVVPEHLEQARVENR